MSDCAERISPDPVATYQQLARLMAETITSWVPLIRQAEHDLEPLLPPEPQRMALLNSEEPGVTTLPLELWGWTDTLLGDNLMPALALLRQIAGLTEEHPESGAPDFFKVWSEVDAEAPTAL